MPGWWRRALRWRSDEIRCRWRLWRGWRRTEATQWHIRRWRICAHACTVFESVAQLSTRMCSASNYNRNGGGAEGMVRTQYQE